MLSTNKRKGMFNNMIISYYTIARGKSWLDPAIAKRSFRTSTGSVTYTLKVFLSERRDAAGERALFAGDAAAAASAAPLRPRLPLLSYAQTVVGDGASDTATILENHADDEDDAVTRVANTRTRHTPIALDTRPSRVTGALLVEVGLDPRCPSHPYIVWSTDRHQFEGPLVFCSNLYAPNICSGGGFRVGCRRSGNYTGPMIITSPVKILKNPVIDSG
nr:unnamed protein product [Callosobruchus analis]